MYKVPIVDLIIIINVAIGVRFNYIYFFLQRREALLLLSLWNPVAWESSSNVSTFSLPDR